MLNVITILAKVERVSALCGKYGHQHVEGEQGLNIRIVRPYLMLNADTHFISEVFAITLSMEISVAIFTCKWKELSFHFSKMYMYEGIILRCFMILNSLILFQ